MRNLKHYLGGRDLVDLVRGDKEEILKKRRNELSKEIRIHIDFAEVQEYPSLFRVTLSDGCDIHENGTWDFINKKLSSPGIIDENGQPIKSGFSEIFICSTMLRGCDIVEMGQIKDPPLISLESKDKRCLKYTFFLWKGEPVKKIETQEGAEEFMKGELQGIDNRYRYRLFLTSNEELYCSLTKVRKGLINDKAVSNDEVWGVLPEQISNDNELRESWVRFWLKGSIEWEQEKKDSVTIGFRLTIGNEEFTLSHGNNLLLPDPSNKFASIHQPFSELLADPTSIYKNEVAEVLGTKMLIVDERAFEKWQRLSGEPLKWFQRINLGIAYPKDRESLEELNEDYHFAIFHSSLLDIILEDDEKVSRFLDQFSSKYIVITSGKGPPTWFKEEFLFMPYYDTESCMNLNEGELSENCTDRLYFVKRALLEILMAR